VEVAWVGRPDAPGDGQHQGVVGRVLPALEVVAVEPDDIREAPVAAAEVAAVGVGLILAVAAEGLQPATRLDGIEEHGQALSGGQADHRVGAGEVVLVGRRQVSGRLERRNAVVGGPVGSAAGVLHTEQVHPHRVEAGPPAVAEECRGLRHGEVDDHGLGRVAHDQERAPALIDQVPARRAHLQGIDRGVGRHRSGGRRCDDGRRRPFAAVAAHQPEERACHHQPDQQAPPGHDAVLSM
jgi:hypothetical protein